MRRSSPSITPWRVTDENRRFIMDEMERVFQVPSEGILEYQLENIAINLAREYWDDFKKPILDIVADSFLEEYDEYNIEVAFKTAVANSVSYAMYSRITENPDGVPFTVVLYRDEQGNTIPQDFLSELDPPPKGFRVEDAPVIDLEEEAPSVDEAEESPFVAQVMRDVEAIAAEEESYERFSVIETENGYAA